MSAAKETLESYYTNMQSQQGERATRSGPRRVRTRLTAGRLQRLEQEMDQLSLSDQEVRRRPQCMHFSGPAEIHHAVEPCGARDGVPAPAPRQADAERF